MRRVTCWLGVTRALFATLEIGAERFSKALFLGANLDRVGHAVLQSPNELAVRRTPSPPTLDKSIYHSHGYQDKRGRCRQSDPGPRHTPGT